MQREILGQHVDVCRIRPAACDYLHRVTCSAYARLCARCNRQGGDGDDLSKAKKDLVIWFDKIGKEDVDLVGGKNASLGEMIRNLGKKGVNVPSGFAVTAYAYKYMMEKAGIDRKIRDILSDLDTNNVIDLAERGQKIRNLIISTPIPSELEKFIRKFYREMEKRYGKNVDVAVEET